jgi:hypothetical protein
MNMVTRSFMQLALPIAALIALITLAAYSLFKAITLYSLGLYFTTVMLIAFCLIPTMLIHVFFLRNKRVLLRTSNTEITYHSSYPRVPIGLITFLSNYHLEQVEDAIVLHLSMHTDCVINRGFDRVNLSIEFCPQGLVQGSHRDRLKKVGGLLYENKIQVAWISEDHTAMRNMLRHELGHILLDVNHPEMSVTKQHEVLTKCHV